MSTPKNSETTSQETRAREAMKLKRDGADGDVPYPTDQTPNLGKKRIEQVSQAPSGALDHAGEKPSRERSGPR